MCSADKDAAYQIWELNRLLELSSHVMSIHLEYRNGGSLDLLDRVYAIMASPEDDSTKSMAIVDAINKFYMSTV